METIVLSVKVVNEVLEYLNGRPHVEVRTMIDSIVSEGQKQAEAAQAVPDVAPVKPAKKAKAKVAAEAKA